ncbi:Ctf8-domain-containing protein [Aspergillus cavernicola]|uniref:Ctf8-domain-containing protein n=1 Tax=Aspergillus cavernicola TaxID=176166 RepID=A0ABR4J5B0_9EURO
MAPSEPSILSNFLLSAASLPTIMSLQQFTELFPKRLRSHPHIRVLYRELQQLREQDMDIVNENIDREVRQGDSQKAELRRSLAKTGVDGADLNDQREIDMDVQLFGQTSASSDEYHSVPSLLSAMETACTSIEQEIAGVDRDAATLLSELNSTVGGMSDLRYGKMHGSVGPTDEEVVSEAIRGLDNLEDVCYRTINLPTQVNPLVENDLAETSSDQDDLSIYETPIGKLLFPDHSPQNAMDDTKWMKRAYLYVGRYQRMTGEVKKLPKPLAVIRRRQPQGRDEAGASDELEIVEIVRYKLVFKNRPEPVNDV